MQYNRVGDGGQPRWTLGVLGRQQASPREPATVTLYRMSRDIKRLYSAKQCLGAGRSWVCYIRKFGELHTDAEYRLP